MNICKVCAHQRVNEADAWLADGETQARVARRLGLDRQIVGRHVRHGHVRRTTKPAQPPREITDAEFDLADSTWLAEVLAEIREPGWTRARLAKCDEANASHESCAGCSMLLAKEPEWDRVLDRQLRMTA